MKRLIALCLILSAGLSASACGIIPKPENKVVVVKNDVPPSLLDCAPAPALPDLDTGDNTRNWKNQVAYSVKGIAAGQDCRDKLGEVKGLILIPTP